MTIMAEKDLGSSDVAALVRRAVDGDQGHGVGRGGRELVQGGVRGPQRRVAADRAGDVLGGVRQLAVIEGEPGERELPLGFRASLADAFRHAPPPFRSADTIARKATDAGQITANQPPTARARRPSIVAM